MAQAYNPLLQPKDEELERARQYAQMPQAQRAAMDARLMENQAVQGAESIGRGVLGLGPSEQANRGGAANEIRELARKVTPGTPEFYKAAAAIYQQYGLPAEAERMTQLLNEVEFGKGESQDVLKLQRVRDYLKKRLDGGDQSVKAAIDAIDRKLGTYGQTGSPPADPEFIKLLNEYETAVTAGQGGRAEAIKKAMDAYIAQKERAGGNADEIRNKRLALDQKKHDLAVKKDDDKNREAEQSAVRSLQAIVRIMNEQTRAAQSLLNHPGLPYITGRWVGAASSRIPALFSDAAADAAVYMRTVQAQAFLAALSDLRATSKSGASGLGQLTEKEGDKIQAAKDAIDAQQTTEQFKANLGNYIAQLQGSRGVGEKELLGAKAEVPPLLPPVQYRKQIKDVAPGARPRPGDPQPAPAPKPKRTFNAVKVE